MLLSLQFMRIFRAFLETVFGQKVCIIHSVFWIQTPQMALTTVVLFVMGKQDA